MKTGIVWFRQDLRLTDNPALRAACKECDLIVPLFVAEPGSQSVANLGAASKVWLHHSLSALKDSLEARGSTLLFLAGDAEELIATAAKFFKADALYWNRCYDPASIKRDKKIKKQLHQLNPKSFNALLNEEPWNTVKADGTAYKVFTPYWNARTKSLPGEKPLAAPSTIACSEQILGSANSRQKKLPLKRLDQLSLLPKLSWHEPMMSGWTAGENGAKRTLDAFLKKNASNYKQYRDIPSVDGTSRLSTHLHFGEISPRTVFYKLLNGRRDVSELNAGEYTFAKEVIWREFAYSLLFHFPHTITKPLNEKFANFPWESRYGKHLRAWQTGQTGVPIVDAGMRQLYATGWMHNRVRMIVGSYLVKNLLIPWQEGERWFRDTLLDADLASNVMGWQWVAGSGADAAPYFRVFNPVLQGEKFDAKAEYVKQWVPELSNVELRYIHKPWELTSAQQQQLNYPEPLVDLKQSRQRALMSYDRIK